MPSFKENVKSWCSRLFDQKPVQYATMYMPSGNSSSRDSLDAASDDVGKELIEKDMYSRLPLSAHREPWWKRTTVLVISHMVLFTVYAAVLFAVVSSKTKSARMEGMPVCALILFTFYMTMLMWLKHLQFLHSNGKNTNFPSRTAYKKRGLIQASPMPSWTKPGTIFSTVSLDAAVNQTTQYTN